MHNEKSIGTVLAETKEELKDFLQTRLAILKAELSEKVQGWKAVIPMAVTGVVLLLSAWGVLTFALVALLAGLFQPRPLAWFFAAAIVTVTYGVIGAAVAGAAVSRIKVLNMTPKRTLEVLKQDQIWIQKETKAA